MCTYLVYSFNKKNSNRTLSSSSLWYLFAFMHECDVNGQLLSSSPKRQVQMKHREQVKKRDRRWTCTIYSRTLISYHSNRIWSEEHTRCTNLSGLCVGVQLAKLLVKLNTHCTFIGAVVVAVVLSTSSVRWKFYHKQQEYINEKTHNNQQKEKKTDPLLWKQKFHI